MFLHVATQNKKSSFHFLQDEEKNRCLLDNYRMSRYREAEGNQKMKKKYLSDNNICEFIYFSPLPGSISCFRFFFLVSIDDS
jgi:hypothetical protein